MMRTGRFMSRPRQCPTNFDTPSPVWTVPLCDSRYNPARTHPCVYPFRLAQETLICPILLNFVTFY